MYIYIYIDIYVGVYIEKRRSTQTRIISVGCARANAANCEFRGVGNEEEERERE